MGSAWVRCSLFNQSETRQRGCPCSSHWTHREGDGEKWYHQSSHCESLGAGWPSRYVSSPEVSDLALWTWSLHLSHQNFWPQGYLRNQIFHLGHVFLRKRTWVSESFIRSHKVNIVFLFFASLLSQVPGDKGQDSKFLDFFLIFAFIP